MNILPILEQRYATKKFDTKRRLSEADLSQIKALLRLSPSSINLQPWHFILADSESGKARIAKSATEAYQFNHDKIMHAALSVVFCARTLIDDAYIQHVIEQEERDGRFERPEVKEMQYNTKYRFTRIHQDELNDLPHWVEKQVYLNIGSFLLGVAALGLDAVPIEGVDIQVLNQEFDLAAQGLNAVAVVSVGYRSPQDDNASRPKSRLPESEILTLLP